ncbi:expressed unknown protein [Seminavis robusta]|uniref:Uncharacterized protein n=1 Tax=Seminavis robusta TaxID=568900 RepID=A0A9N8HPW5_9STRA|nr:expressed unknown protein [Seminavis robusta]|eukprot:Sro1111_g242390.1 n/a (233) ;mRNA; f:2527-3225
MNQNITKEGAKMALSLFPEGDTKEFLAQTVADFAVGCDISPVLSERLTPEYMFQNMGGLDGPEEGDLQRLQNVEAYKIEFAEEDAEFVVDRRSIYNPHQEKADYDAAEDTELINQGIQDWFKRNVFEKGRTPGCDPTVVEEAAANCKQRFGIGPCLKYGILHSCAPVQDAQRNKTMFIEFYGTLLNVERYNRDWDRTFPYVHLWEHEELRFRMRAITYSDIQYLTVHMPGYG